MTSPFDLGEESPGRVVRPYVLTGGRTTAGDLLVETLVVALEPMVDTPTDERRRIVEVCREPTAVAEIAARIDLPLGIVRVLVADLVDSGHMKAYDTAAPDDAMIVRRILDAIRPT